MAPTDITPIHVPYPEAPDLELKIIADGCHIDIKPEAANDWVSGTYQDPSGQRSPRITQDGGTLTIDHARTTTNVVGELTAGTPRFDLVLGTGQPYALTIQAAAIESYAELAGLPITRLVINQRAGQSRISFGQANPQPAELLHISAQGATIETRNLANANAAAISLDGDATRYLVDFGGELQRNTHAAVSARASSGDHRTYIHRSPDLRDIDARRPGRRRRLQATGRRVLDPNSGLRRSSAADHRRLSRSRAAEAAGAKGRGLTHLTSRLPGGQRTPATSTARQQRTGHDQDEQPPRRGTCGRYLRLARLQGRYVGMVGCRRRRAEASARHTPGYVEAVRDGGLSDARPKPSAQGRWSCCG